MRRCAFLTMDNAEGFVICDELLYEPMAAAGWQVDAVPWTRADVCWDDYEAVVIRSPWDYQDDPQRFLKVLSEIEASSARLVNSLATVRWNIDKRYLQVLEQSGVQIVPTEWSTDGSGADVKACFDVFACDEIVIKPTVSANSDNTFRLNRSQCVRMHETLSGIFAQRPFMVQPFMQSIIDEGEYSLFYFGGAYSHAVLKTPKSGDFRVQEEHGGVIVAHCASDALRALADAALACVHVQPFYARIDFVRYRDSFAVMEMELIEPSLYFNYDSESPQRFTQAFINYMAPAFG